MHNKNTYIHTYVHTYIHTYIRTYIHTYIHTYKVWSIKDGTVAIKALC